AVALKKTEQITRPTIIKPVLRYKIPNGKTSATLAKTSHCGLAGKMTGGIIVASEVVFNAVKTIQIKGTTIVSPPRINNTCTNHNFFFSIVFSFVQQARQNA